MKDAEIREREASLDILKYPAVVIVYNYMGQRVLVKKDPMVSLTADIEDPDLFDRLTDEVQSWTERRLARLKEDDDHGTDTGK